MPSPHPKVNRTGLNAAQAALRQLDNRRKQEEADLPLEEKALAEKRATAQKAYVEARKQTTANIAAMHGAYRKAGGTD